MDGLVSDRRKRLKRWTISLHAFVRRTHRVAAALWVLSVSLTFVVTAAGGELPGPSVPALSLIALIITGGYLHLRPWVRGTRIISARWIRLDHWNVALPVLVRRAHRVTGVLWVLFLVLGLSIDAAGGTVTSLIIIPVVVLLIALTITGGYMLLRPWVNRFRAR